MSNPVIVENQNTGTTAWNFVNGATTEIQAYLSSTSYNPGDTLTAYVSTQVGGTTYSVNIYRLGWYSGFGGRLLQTATGQVGVAQGYWDGSVLQNCPTAFSDSTTHLLEARWASSYTLTIPSNWTTGVYLILFTDANGKQYATSFVVKGNTTADYVVVRPYCTDAAYNQWGGNSLYTSNSVSNIAATKVSFDRPNANFHGCAGALIYEAAALHWLEQQGYNLSYLSDIDVHTNPAQLLNYKVILSIGHDEYWSKSRYDGTLAALNAGKSLCFLGANACYWQVRMESGGQNGANRTLVGYKVSTSYPTVGNGALSNDPYYSVGNTLGTNNLVTTQWRDAVLNRPENAMIGIMYGVNTTTTNPNVAWVVDASADTTYLAGTGLVPGQSYGSDVVGYEWDLIQSGSPAGLKTIGTSPIYGSTSNTTWYRAASGALVFASGSIQWCNCLDGYRWGGSVVAPVSAMQTLFANVMGALKGPVFGNLGGH